MAAQRAGVCASAFHPRAAAAIDLLLHAAARVVDLDLCRARAGRRVGIETPRGGRRSRAEIAAVGFGTCTAAKVQGQVTRGRQYLLR